MRWAVVLALSILISSASVSAERTVLVDLPNMDQGRYNHTSAAYDGGLMVIGGTDDGYRSLDSVEYLKDGRWSVLEPLYESRMRHASVTLRDGRVLVTGGYQGVGGAHPSLTKHFINRSVSLSSCELYDGTWTKGPDLMTGRFWHSMVVLGSGAVLVIGGLNSTSGALASCEIYHAGEWRETAPLSSPRARFTTTLLPDGRVLVTGGHDGLEKRSESTCEIFDPIDERWVIASPMLEPRGYHGAVMLPDGKVLVSGGFASPTEPDRKSSEIYDPSADTWSMAGNMSFPRHNHRLVRLGDLVLSIGGSNCETGGAHSNVEAYDGAWYETGMIMVGRIWLEADEFEGSVISHGGKACGTPHFGAESFSIPASNDTSFPWYLLLAAIPMALWRRRFGKDRP